LPPDSSRTRVTDWSGFFIPNKNSSTNANRRRAAAILKTFFCDDLSPLNVVAPAVDDGIHGSNRHASDPSCQACHYRLDPMAGFFKNHGIAGINLITEALSPEIKKGLEEITGQTVGGPGEILVFDDLAFIAGAELQDYLSQWRKPRGQTAYIRSLSDPQLNLEGDTLADLETIIQTAPEVKRCLAQRMVEYYIGPDQSVPGEWKDDLANRLNVSNSESAKAYVDVVREIVLSKTFLVPDPEPGVCYEESDSASKTGIPCEISHLLQRNCVQCHSANAASGGLALDRMGSLSDGSSNFYHTSGATNCQQTRVETFDALLQSLTTSDEDKRMPLMKHMDPLDREKLIRWVTEESAKSTRQ
jgi:mono/diheme cytochrome c family protein